MDFVGFQPPLWAATVMNAFDRPWCIAGGWAIDLWLRHPTRDHGEVKIAILRDDQIALRDFLSSAPAKVITAAGQLAPWPTRQMLMFPVSQILFELSRGHELRVWLNESSPTCWLYSRDARIRLPLAFWRIRAAFGVPVIAPEIALLYKAADMRAKDKLDFLSTLESLDLQRRRWLANALQILDAAHPWLGALANTSSSS